MVIIIIINSSGDNRKNNKVPTRVICFIKHHLEVGEKNFDRSRKKVKSQNHIIELKIYRQVLRFKPIPSVLELCCPTHCAMEPLELLTNVSKIINVHDTIEIRTRNYCFRNFYPNLTELLSQAHCRDLFFNKKSREKHTEEKRKTTLQNE